MVGIKFHTVTIKSVTIQKCHGYLTTQVHLIFETGLCIKISFFKDLQHSKKKPVKLYLKVHKIENFFDSDFGICVFSLLVMSKY